MLLCRRESYHLVVQDDIAKTDKKSGSKLKSLFHYVELLEDIGVVWGVVSNLDVML